MAEVVGAQVLAACRVDPRLLCGRAERAPVVVDAEDEPGILWARVIEKGLCARREGDFAGVPPLVRLVDHAEDARASAVVLGRF
ncbi:MAG: hypothetical protein WBN15_17540 [Polyangiales bacterium]